MRTMLKMIQVIRMMCKLTVARVMEMKKCCLAMVTYKLLNRTRQTAAVVEGEDLQPVTVIGCNPVINWDTVRVFKRFFDIFFITSFCIFAGLESANLFYLFMLAPDTVGTVL